MTAVNRFGFPPMCGAHRSDQAQSGQQCVFQLAHGGPHRDINGDVWESGTLGVDLRWGADRLLYGHAGGFGEARRLAQHSGVHHLTSMVDVIVVDPMGLVRMMQAGGGRSQWSSDGSITVYLDSAGTTLTLWCLVPPIAARCAPSHR